MPDDNDTARFGMTTSASDPQTYTVAFTADATNAGLVVEDDRVTFALNGHIYATTASGPIFLGTSSTATARLTVTDGIVIAPFNSHVAIGSGSEGFLTVTTGGLLIGSPAIDVGDTANGTLTIDNNGDIIASDVRIGDLPGITGKATITGGGSSLLAAELTVGPTGTGTLNVAAGGDVDSASAIIGDLAGGMGIANIDGAGSTWDNSVDLIVGRIGSGTLNVTAGGVVENHRNGFIGFGADATGIVTVDGATSQWINSSVLQVGLSGHGELNITGGARVQNSESNVGVSDGSTGIALVRGSTWTNTSSLNVGFYGEGTLTVEAGGSVSSVGGSVGTLDGSNGTATVTGAGSAWTNSGNLSVGEEGMGMLSITDGGQVSSSGNLFVGDRGTGTLNIATGGQLLNTINGVLGNDAGSSGTVTVSGPNSRWNMSDRLTVGNSGNGFLTIEAGGSVSNDLGIISGGSASGSVTVRGAGSTWTNGLLSVGLFGIGTLRIQTGGTVSATQGTVLSDGGALHLEGGTLSTSEIDFLGPMTQPFFGPPERFTSACTLPASPFPTAEFSRRAIRQARRRSKAPTIR